MKKYLYKNIVLYKYYGTWQADYQTHGDYQGADLQSNGRFSLHNCCCDTKREAYEIAKEQVDFLNREEN